MLAATLCCVNLREFTPSLKPHAVDVLIYGYILKLGILKWVLTSG